MGTAQLAKCLIFRYKHHYYQIKKLLLAPLYQTIWNPKVEILTLHLSSLLQPNLGP